ncbi:MAG TPA: hypothetical protein PLV25_00415 [Opitutales bacterium]|nr:hypothetical protein [Opitutales bacterium]
MSEKLRLAVGVAVGAAVAVVVVVVVTSSGVASIPKNLNTRSVLVPLEWR